MPKSKTKGSRGEREVVAIWRSHGWTDAARTPGSGALRPWGAGDVPAWPGDVAFIRPWLCEVKFDERLKEGRGRTWVGSTATKGFLRELLKLTQRLNGTYGGTRYLPVLAARASMQGWTWWVPVELVDSWGGRSGRSAFGRGPGPQEPGETTRTHEWVGLGEDEFFTLALHLAPPEPSTYVRRSTLRSR